MPHGDIAERVSWDADILLWINSHHAAWADTLMWYISQAVTWVPLYVVLIASLCYRRGWRQALWIVLTIGLAVGLSDYISSGIIKHAVCRLRPTHNPDLAPLLHLVRGYVGGMYGFVSSHAANTMAVATVYSLVRKNRWVSIGLYTWVALNCYSRMYLGVHYPGDILGGIMVGGLVAWMAYWVLHRLGGDAPSDD